MADRKNNPKGLSNYQLNSKAQQCITILANVYGKRKEVTKTEAMQTLNLSDEEYPLVMGILENLDVIEAEPAGAERYDRLTIKPKVVELAHADIVERVRMRFRRSPVFAWLIITFVSLATLSAVVNQGFTSVKNVQQAVSAQKTVMYKGQPLVYWEERLHDLHDGTARDASAVLHRLGTHAVPGLIRALSSKNKLTVELAVKTLGDIGENAVEAIAELEKLKGTQPSLRPHIDDALKKMKGQ